jgi:hypothetical protein
MDKIGEGHESETNGAILPRLNPKKRLSAGNIGKVVHGAFMPRFGAIKSHNFLFF